MLVHPSGCREATSIVEDLGVVVHILVKKYGKKAGINFSITPHTMRRTFATHLYEQTGDIRLTADALHHSSVDTTAKHYAKASVEKKREAAKIADDLFK